MREPPPQPSGRALPPSVTPLARATIFEMDPDDEASEACARAIAWFKRWGGRVRVADYSSTSK